MPTLALNIITKDEAFELNRLLESCKGELFDELVIVRTHESQEIIDICEKFGVKHYYFKWIKDFSAARNYCIEKTRCDYILWNDSDDVIKPEDYKKLLEQKPKLTKDIYLIDYVYSHLPDDSPESILPRERIFKNIPAMRFQGRIHEALPPILNLSWEKLNGICTHHYRMRSNDANRNLELLKLEYEQKPLDPRTQFYYGKDLYANGDISGIPILELFVRSGLGSLDDRVLTCITLARHYFNDSQLSKLFCFHALSLLDKYAEVFFILGSLFKTTDKKLAINYFNLATKCSIGTTLLTQQPCFYGHLPYSELSVLYYETGDYMNALDSNIKSHKESHNVGLVSDRKLLFEKNNLKVGWLNSSDVVNPISRLQQLIHNEILKYNVKSELTSTIGDYDVMVFNSFNQIEECRKFKGFKILHLCEDISHMMLNEVDLIVCCSTRLQEKVQERGFKNTVVIRDPYEPVTSSTTYREIEKPKLVFCGMGGNQFLVTDWLKDVISRAGYELVTISEWDSASIKWELDTWQKHMCDCDVAICPQRQEIQDAKSNVKVTNAMALGIPVVASNINSYSEVIKHGENGYLCNTQEEFYDALVALRDLKLREKIGLSGKNSISKYSVEYISQEWINVLSKPIVEKRPIVEFKSVEPVDIIICSYNNLEYLKQTVTSILLQTDYPYRLIISDAGSNQETWDYLKSLKGITVLGECEKRINFSQCCNNGILNSQTKYFMILNNDVVISWDCIKNLVEKMNTVPRLAVCGVLSNCDRGWLFKDEFNMNCNGVELQPGMKLGSVDVNSLYGFMRTSNEKLKGKYKSQPWVAFYAVMLARSAVNEVGLLDPNYINGFEDLDYCVRLKKYNYEIGQSLDSFVFHYGGISRKSDEEADYERYHKEDKINLEYFNKKWYREVK